MKRLKRRKHNEIVYHEGYAEVLLYDKTGNEKDRSLIDLEDVAKIKNYVWCIKDNGYAYCRLPDNRKLFMHKIIMGTNHEIDHCNRNRLDNRKTNLRVATRQQNSMNQSLKSNNTSGIKGVYWDKNRQTWNAEIMKAGKKYHLGRYKHKEQAAQIRQSAELQLFGEFSALVNL
jgi:hypothetical protein